jgi:hypothetical protein
MNPDARLSTALPTHHKTKKLHKRLGGNGCWSLVCLFLYAARNKPSGDLVGMSDEDIEIAANWTGDDGVLIATLTDVRFLDGEPMSRRIHDWSEHNPWAFGADRRSESARQAAETRWNKGSMPSASESHAPSKRVASKRNTPLPSPSPSPESSARRGTRLTDDWKPTKENWIWAVGEIGKEAAIRELSKFRDYWPSVAGRHGVKLDWERTFRNWIRSAAERMPTASQPHGTVASNPDGSSPRKVETPASKIKAVEDWAKNQRDLGNMLEADIQAEVARVRAKYEPLLGAPNA